MSGGVFSDGTGVLGVAVVLTGAGTQFTDTNGLFAFSVASGYSGTLSCSFEFNGSFSPSEYVYNSVFSDMPDQNFVYNGTVVVLSDDEFTIVSDDEGVVIAL